MIRPHVSKSKPDPGHLLGLIFEPKTRHSNFEPHAAALTCIPVRGVYGEGDRFGAGSFWVPCWKQIRRQLGTLLAEKSRPPRLQASLHCRGVGPLLNQPLVPLLSPQSLWSNRRTLGRRSIRKCFSFLTPRCCRSLQSSPLMCRHGLMLVSHFTCPPIQGIRGRPMQQWAVFLVGPLRAQDPGTHFQRFASTMKTSSSWLDC